MTSKEVKLERCTFLGHKGRCFDIRISPDNCQFISASEDGASKIWSLATQKCLYTVSHNKNAEVLRSVFITNETICTGGSDGKVLLWKTKADSNIVKAQRTSILHHRNEESQIYACECLSSGADSQSSMLCTAADNQVYLWDIATVGERCSSSDSFRTWNFSSLECSERNFGGPRNENNDVFVFDAKVSASSSDTLAVALSDSTIRLLDTREPSESTASNSISLANQKEYQGISFGHATSVSWSKDSSSLLVSLGSGKLAIIDSRMNTIRAVLVHHRSAAYGGSFIAADSKCISWSSDTCVCSWDVATANGLCSEILNSVSIPGFPILSCAALPNNAGLLCGGGGGKTADSFIGTPIHQIEVDLVT